MANRNDKTKLLQEAVLVNIDSSMGNVSMACDKTGISRQIFYTWYNEDSKFRERVLDIHERNIDLSETTIHKASRAGSLDAAKFVVSRLGKDRGWTERQEFKDTTPKTLDLSNLSDKDLKTMAKIHEKMKGDAK